MRDYAVLLRYDILKLKNYILEIRRTPKKLVSYFLYLAWFVLILFPAIKHGGQRPFAVSRNTMEIILAVYALFIGFTMFAAFFASLKKLSYSFQMGDVNILFPSPLEPNRILLWSIMKTIPLAMLTTCFPVLIFTPMMSNMGIGIEGILLAYLSVLSLALLLTPVAFLIFLISARYKKEPWVRAVLLLSVVWLAFNWLKYQRFDIFSFQVLLGYQAPEILNFPLFGWILQLARAAFFGPTPGTYTMVLLVVLTALFANLMIFLLARDYYEDVMERAEKLEALRASRAGGNTRGIFLSMQSGNWGSLLRRFWGKKIVTVERRFPESRAFMFNQVVKYRRTGINEYLGYLAPLSVTAGLVIGFIALHQAHPAGHAMLYFLNGGILYLLLLRGSASPMGEELALPYIYTLPGTFFNKALAVNTLPTLRFGINVILLNLSYATILYLSVKNAGIFMPAMLMSLLLTSFYLEQCSIIVLAHVLLPSSIDRKLFYPLILLVEILLLGIPALIAGCLAAWLTRSAWVAGIAVLMANTAMGIILLLFSDKIFSYLEMREFSE